MTDAKKTVLRHKVHIGFAILLWLVILAFKLINSKAIIDAIFTLASYTYGPLLGLFAFGLFMRAPVKDAWVPLVCCVSPVICFVMQKNSAAWFNGYKIGFELLMLNGLLTFLGLCLIRKPAPAARA
jgi:hypothetical protein